MEKKKKITIQKKVEVSLPDVPKLKDGEIAMRLVYQNGQSRDIIGNDMCECVEAGKKQARDDGKNFLSPDHVKAWDRIA